MRWKNMAREEEGWEKGDKMSEKEENGEQEGEKLGEYRRKEREGEE